MSYDNIRAIAFRASALVGSPVIVRLMSGGADVAGTLTASDAGALTITDDDTTYTVRTDAVAAIGG